LPSDFLTGCEINACVLGCATGGSCSTNWTINQDSKYSRGGSGNSAMAGTFNNYAGDCEYTYMGFKKEVPAGDLTFWVWYPDVAGFSLDDKFEFLLDGKEKSAFFDFPTIVKNEVSYPANLATTIAVGASTDGVYQGTGNQTPNLSKEARAYYSQYGGQLDLVAPSGNQHMGITTTDRTGDDGYHLASLTETFISDTNYTSHFGGTSAAAPMVAGTLASMIGALNANSSIAAKTADELRGFLNQGADQIGSYTYDLNSGKSDETGHGRLNVYQSIQHALGLNNQSSAELCTTGSQSFIRNAKYESLIDIDASFGQCATLVDALQPPEDDGFCFPIKAKNGGVAVICL